MLEKVGIAFTGTQSISNFTIIILLEETRPHPMWTQNFWEVSLPAQWRKETSHFFVTPLERPKFMKPTSTLHWIQPHKKQAFTSFPPFPLSKQLGRFEENQRLFFKKKFPPHFLSLQLLDFTPYTRRGRERRAYKIGGELITAF